MSQIVKKIILSAVACISIWHGPNAHSLWIEDFKGGHLGLDQDWSASAIHFGNGRTQLKSDGEIGKLCLDSENAFRCSVDLLTPAPCDRVKEPFIQLRFSRLSRESRIKLFLLPNEATDKPIELLNHKNATDSLNSELITLKVNDRTKQDFENLRLRLELVRDSRQRDSRNAEVYVDWIKCGMAEPGEKAPTMPGHIGPPQGESFVQPPLLKWSRPPKYQGNRYTLSLSRDPLFAADCTTVLDGIDGTSYQPQADLAPGKWHWTVSATSSNGLSGDFLVNRDQGVPYSFTISGNDEGMEKEYPHFSLRAGSQGFGSVKKFSDEPKLVEQARLMLEIGSEAYKFLLGADADNANYVSVYQDLSTDTRHRSHTLVQLIENEPAYQTVFDLPFKYFVMWVQPMDAKFRLGDGNYQGDAAKLEYDQLYDLTRYFMSKYQGTGKIFLIGHWEGDNMLMEGRDLIKDQPDPVKLADMRQWLRNRQKAVEDARRSMPNASGVEVYNYAELNILTPVLENNLPRLINAVLPEVAVDLVSYSAYNCMNHTDELPERAWAHFDYILKQAKFTGAWKHSKPVFMGEYGIPSPLEPVRPARNLVALKSAASWGSIINLYWSIYTQLPNGNSSLIELDGKPNQEFRDIKNFIGKMNVLKHATRTWLDRNPTELEANYLAIDFDVRRPSELLAEVINSLDAQIRLSDEAYIDLLIAALGLNEDQAASLKRTLSDSLINRSVSRFDALLRALDSPQFHEAISQDSFEDYLYSRMLLAERSRQNGVIQSTKRSEQFLEAINSEDFAAKDLEFSGVNRLTKEIRLKYRPDYRADATR